MTIKLKRCCGGDGVFSLSQIYNGVRRSIINPSINHRLLRECGCLFVCLHCILLIREIHLTIYTYIPGKYKRAQPLYRTRNQTPATIPLFIYYF